MTQLQLLKSLLNITAGVVELKRMQMRQMIRRTVSHTIHVKQYEQTEQELAKALDSFFSRQIASVASGLAAIAPRKQYNTIGTKQAAEVAATLAREAFNPRDWDRELINAIAPVMIRDMGEAALAQMATLGVNVRKSFEKATTATEWLESADPDDLAEMIFDTSLGELPMRFATEWPAWLKVEIKNRLMETFAQPYWKGINDTSLVDIGKFIDQGLADGWSIARIASEMRGAAGLGFEYYRHRSENIARTESANALNGARDASYRHFKEEMGEAGQFVNKSWLSVLGNTTRDAHANLDGVLADKNGMWNLNGVTIPWPGHIKLPASDRCNCRCTITTEFGIGAPESELQQLMQEMEERSFELQEKYKPGQPRVPAGSPAGGEFGTASGMTGAVRDSDGKLTMSDGSPLPDHLPKNIPPAWTDVRVNPDPKADLLVQGRDTKGRVQSVYSESHKTRQAAKKFARVNGMRGEQKRIEQEVKADMKSPVPSIRENATVLRLIQETGIRPGGTGDTKAEKQAYGATTLEGRHVRVSTTGNVRLQFVGKKGVDINVSVKDKTLSKELVKRKETAGAKGKLFNTNSSSLRSYTKSKDGGQLHPKDFRTAKGTETAIAAMKGMKAPKTDREYKQAVRKVAKEVAAQLGNTPTVALQSYIDPSVFSKWRI